MSNAIEGIGIGISGGSRKGLSLLGKENEKKKEQVAYMGPSIGGLLNGSVPPQPTASASQV